MKIDKQDLPLAPDRLAQVRGFCQKQIKAGRVRVLDGIPDILRKDWLDTSLPGVVRANQHANVDPQEWRLALEGVCAEVIRACQQGQTGESAALLMWRAALAFHQVLLEYGIRSCHLDVKRDECNLRIHTRLPLSQADGDLLRSLGRGDSLLIPDPMLASGSSVASAIDLVRSFGIREDRIIVGCVVAAPEGIFNLLNQFPGIKIVAAAMDACLNADAYIVPGLGDAGGKYFCGNSLYNFSRDVFTSDQWQHLKGYFK